MSKFGLYHIFLTIWRLHAATGSCRCKISRQFGRQSRPKYLHEKSVRFKCYLFIFTQRAEFNVISYISYQMKNCLFVRCRFISVALNCSKIVNGPLCMRVAVTLYPHGGHLDFICMQKNVNTKMRIHLKNLQFCTTLVNFKA